MTPRTATGLIAIYMRLCGFQGWTSLWNTIYLAPGFENDTRLIKHELKHLEQMRRDGKVVFMVKYVYWHLKYGYLFNPYEIEARLAEQL